MEAILDPRWCGQSLRWTSSSGCLIRLWGAELGACFLLCFRPPCRTSSAPMVVWPWTSRSPTTLRSTITTSAIWRQNFDTSEAYGVGFWTYALASRKSSRRATKKRKKKKTYNVACDARTTSRDPASPLILVSRRGFVMAEFDTDWA
ncbi:hypothetical protein FA15DRAFT_460464 [Coprinopsis marcescibilis]|uniref:Uncharacterized protein n=1 Tax=Coprinopsis marcescibilis TaxID=230819 RepID=A0A5C3KSW4_COPMA|nr:hypothetical protein FA15DRAFT_460464 [Coprinopsis marcescibilis]